MVVINKAIGYFDGASRGNPGEAGAGALIKDKEGNVLWECAKYLGIKTNNEAEYNAVIELLKAVKDLGITEIKIYGDSNLVVSQLSRKCPASGPLRSLICASLPRLHGRSELRARRRLLTYGFQENRTVKRTSCPTKL